jgi:hypothetical protein
VTFAGEEIETIFRFLRRPISVGHGVKPLTFSVCHLGRSPSFPELKMTTLTLTLSLAHTALLGCIRGRQLSVKHFFG